MVQIRPFAGQEQRQTQRKDMLTCRKGADEMHWRAGLKYTLSCVKQSLWEAAI